MDFKITEKDELPKYIDVFIKDNYEDILMLSTYEENKNKYIILNFMKKEGRMDLSFLTKEELKEIFKLEVDYNKYRVIVMDDGQKYFIK